MNRGIVLLKAVIISVFFLSGLLPADEEPQPSRWFHPLGLSRPEHRLPEFTGPARIFRVLQFGSGRAGSVAGRQSEPRVVFIVHQSIFQPIQESLQQRLADLAAGGKTALLSIYAGGTAPDLREFLAGLYREPEGLRGAVLIGNLPYALYRDSGWGSSETFPSDLYLMDLDGEWLDDDNDGIYDRRAGDLDAEIWVSRLRADNLPMLGSEEEIMTAYWEKVRAYLADIRPRFHGLAYIDDDWQTMAGQDRDNLALVLGNSGVTAEADPEKTTADDYRKVRMPADQEYILTRSHGSPAGHGYYRSNQSIFEYVRPVDYLMLLPPALFYSFFVCSGSDFTASDNLASVAALNPAAGLLAWGSSKTGGMWHETLFWQELAGGSTFGTAFKEWLNLACRTYPQLAPQWWYGMVMIGDGSLAPRPDSASLFPPSGLRLTRLEDDYLFYSLPVNLLTWVPDERNAGVSGRIVIERRRQDQAGEFSFLAAIASELKRYDDRDLVKGVKYDYRVCFEADDGRRSSFLLLSND